MVVSVLFACSAGGSPAIQAPDLPGFDARRLVDVEGPGDVPPIVHPVFEPIGAASEWLGPDAPVVVVRDEANARAYPLAILVVHEAVDDSIDGVPVAITYSPIANAAVVFDRRAQGLTLTLGSAGKVYQSDLVLYDRETRSLWVQLLETAVAGQLKGRSMRVLPSTLASFVDFVRSYPAGTVLARPGSSAYDLTPFPGYDSRARPYDGFFRGPLDRRVPAMDRVVGVDASDGPIAFSYERLRASGAPVVIEDGDLVVFFGGSARSPLNAPRIAEGRVEGSSGVFLPIARGRRIHLSIEAGAITDRETGSTWSMLGRALTGPLRGEQLPEVPHLDAFWFVWAAFHPGTTLWDGNSEPPSP